ncbi:MAG: glycoside hydrolase family 28 protein [Tannerella sp.]|jgi:polygalacturonase|nr:glycoside hydrolase family 28 protein [Tannerella sp.]
MILKKIFLIVPLLCAMGSLFAKENVNGSDCSGCNSAFLSASPDMNETDPVSGQTSETVDYGSLYENLQFDMPVLMRPVFPDNKVCITEFGGMPDGVTLNTDVFDKAIQALVEKGGGTLIVPDGIWLTGPIVFRSGINLHLEQGALLLFSTDINLYPVSEITYEGGKRIKSRSPISGENLENIAITGKGTINGCGEAWRPLKRAKVTDGHWEQVIKSGGMVKDNIWYPTDKLPQNGDFKISSGDMTDGGEANIRERLRPTMINFVNCKNILLEGVLFDNSPAWNIHPLMCENIIIDNINVRNPYYAQNGDGLDLESCKNVIVVNSTFDVGDDAICLKSGRDEEGRRRGKPTENVIISNCRVYHGHGGFVVGSEMSGGVRNISVSDCQFFGTDVGLRFKSTRGRGGVVENIYIDRIVMLNIVHEPLLFDLYYFVKDRQPDDLIPAVDETTPSFRNIYIKNITSNGGNKAMFFNGLPEMNIDHIEVSNAVIKANLGAEISESQHIRLKDVTIIPAAGPALILNNVKDIKVENFSVPDRLENIVKISGNRNQDIELPENMNEKNIIRE